MYSGNIDSIDEAGRKVPVTGRADVIVAGAGPAGIMAALAAAEEGLKVMLVERLPFVGGNLTLGLPLLGFLDAAGKPIIAGLAQKLIDRLAARNAAGDHTRCPLHVSYTLIDPDEVKATALDMLEEKEVELALHTVVAGVIKDGPDLKGLILEGKGGRQACLGRYVIDCTGDADVAFKAGVSCGKGDERGMMQPPTLMFCLSGVDTEKLRRSIYEDAAAYDVDHIPPEHFRRNKKFIVVGLRGLIKKARAAGLAVPTDRTILITGLRDGDVWVNMTRVKGVDSTDPRSLTRGEVEARRQVREVRDYLVGYVPGFDKAYLSRVAPFLGIRESRRIAGEYVLTREDVLGCRRFDDAVAVASYPVDLHRPDDEDCTLEWCGDSYDIPYRCLVPKGAGNLLVAGRSISSTHEAMAAIRVMPTCMAVGEAAGRACKLAADQGLAPAGVRTDRLREVLAAAGAYLR